MASLKINQIQSLQTRQEFKLFLQLEQANLLEMPEEEFQRFIAEIEKNPLFKKLYQEKVIRYQRFPRTDISPSFYPLKEEVIADKGSFDVESLLLGREDIVKKIKKLGRENFKRYFLYPEHEMTAEEIAEECDLDIQEVEELNSFIDEFSIQSEFYHPSTLSPRGSRHYFKIASIERGVEGFIIGYFSPSNARGKYSINYEEFEGLEPKGFLGKSEVKGARELLRKLELINRRKDTIYQVLLNIVEKQSLYLESADSKALLPFSQKELAKRLGLAPSSVSRAIRDKSIDTPLGEEKPLKDFFPRPRRFKKELIRKILEAEDAPPSDEAIRHKLEEEFGVSISRRSVASLRGELKIPAAWRRKQALPSKKK